jgi:hypothetical protein
VRPRSSRLLLLLLAVALSEECAMSCSVINCMQLCHELVVALPGDGA